MGVTDKLWDAITTVIKMNDKVERMAETIKLMKTENKMLAIGVITGLKMASTFLAKTTTQKTA